MKKLLNEYRKIMEEAGLENSVIETFLHYLQQVIKGDTGIISSQSITPPQREKLVEYDSLEDVTSKHLSKLAVIKLNGGLGTSMGLKQAKSLINVKDKLNFLDIIASQNIALRKKSGAQVPLIFMNSFNTNDETLNYLEKYFDLPITQIPLGFVQNKYPRVRQDNLQPYIDENDELQNWNPPGHGDIYQAMTASGLLDKLLNRGIEYAFISNADNLGAVVDNKILNYLQDNNVPFLMEVCLREEIDKKGGHLAQTASGLILREVAQCPPEELSQFQDVKLYRYFNTNNIWLNLKEMKKEMERKSFALPLIVNAKTVSDTAVYQIETAMGAAISIFNDSKALVVPRSRFAPVKKTNDLITVQSDAYTLTIDYTYLLNSESDSVPVVDLDERYYQTIKQIETRFPAGAPSLKRCKSLKVIGNITFGKNVTFIGNVIITSDKSAKIEDITIEGLNGSSLSN